ncbi:adenylate/guanylate cyclase domain-containing protein [Paracoccaceae bacterium]|nr:adenylate/guanylate cyclase domain-containing protein [Paracoccaceae bacterium]|tara:strand:- start:2008 stop:3291 length:1284 start_codon:yes stop_codon:yes gene_type:complete
MEKDLLVNKRYVNGLRLASITLFGLYLIGFINITFIPVIETPIVKQFASLVMVTGFITFGAVATLLKDENYNICLVFAVAMQIAFPLLFGSLINYEYSATSAYETFGGRLLDYAFVGAAGPMVVSVLFARFYLSIFFVVYNFALALIQVFNIMSIKNTFFTFNYNEIATNINALNGTVFSQNITYLLVVAVGLITLAWVIETNVREATLQERSNNLLGRYFSPEVRDEIEKNKFDLSQSAEKEQNIAVMFTDISDFTKLSEGLEPKEVLNLLSEYQTKMVAAVFQNGGSVDKFIGDSVMATFGTPVSRGNDAQNALNCIRQMQISMREWEKERSESDMPAIKHRVGVHYGSCFVGNVGSEDRVEFTVIGDTVNVASRICEACKEVKSDVLISDEVKLRLSENLPTEEVKNFEVRGRDKKITLHKLTV